ncbi:helix-turn-helix domain-containing protein [Bradyrhizobium sp. 162]|uniref:helix-turn-helix domain-containing protein n=1 Tax=Bradyrhizobium sp. 162 TaxID=2782635 RepID=UPI001FFABC19|nr:helix-turn-helix domain-containing protein [Bradyrhizobium sp. 162]MCK1629751.1 hypothetical protein [Bradyrhizobium sp. 162]
MKTTSENVTDFLVHARPALVATVQETMTVLKIGRAKTYELLNARMLESYLEGSSRKITWRSIEAYVERRLHEEAVRRDDRRSAGVKCRSKLPRGQEAPNGAEAWPDSE